MERASKKLYVLLICVVLVLVTAGVYWQLRGHEFLNIDDMLYVGENEQVLNGLTQEGFVWAFTDTSTTGNWHPLTWLSLMLDCELFESKSRACHITNLLFHLANTLLLFWVLKRMTGALWPSAFVAAAFALHPLHVESVAWVSERKDVLSTFFWLLTMWAYVHHAERPGFTRYVPIVLFFALGLMSKPMLVTLPFVLLLLDYWPLGRLRLNEPGDMRKTVVPLVVEKIPLFVLTAVSSVVTYLGQQSGGAIQPIDRIGLKIRIANAVVSCTNYIGKMIWPKGLAVFYPHLGMRPIWHVVLAGLVLVGISVAVIWWLRRRPYLAVGWLWYIGTLVPVIGLVQIGGQSMADRYTYVPLTGLFIAVAWGITDFTARLRHRKIVLGLCATAVLSALAICTWQQVSYWRNSITLYEHTLAVTKGNCEAYWGLGMALAEKGELDQAIKCYEQALKIVPEHGDIHRHIGLALLQKGQIDQTIKHYSESLRHKPGDYQTHMDMGQVLIHQKKYEQAVRHYKKAIQLHGSFPQAHYNMGLALVRQGKTSEAITQYRKVLELKPDHFRARNNLGAVLLSIGGQLEAAAEQFREALRIKPDYGSAYVNLASVLMMQGKIDEAIWHYREALRIDPSDERALRGLKAALMKRNELGKTG